MPEPAMNANREAVAQKVSSGDPEGALALLGKVRETETATRQEKEFAAYWSCCLLASQGRPGEALEVFESAWETPEEATPEVCALGGYLRAAAGDPEAGYRLLGVAAGACPEIGSFSDSLNRALATAGFQRLLRSDFDSASKAFATVRKRARQIKSPSASSPAPPAPVVESPIPIANVGFRIASLGRWLDRLRKGEYLDALTYLARAQRAELSPADGSQYKLLTLLVEAGSLLHDDPSGRRKDLLVAIEELLGQVQNRELVSAGKSLLSLHRGFDFLAQGKMEEAEEQFRTARTTEDEASPANIAWACLRIHRDPSDKGARRVLEEARERGIAAMPEPEAAALAESLLEKKTRLIGQWGELSTDRQARASLRKVLHVEECLRGAPGIAVPIAPRAGMTSKSSGGDQARKQRLRLLVHRVEEMLPRLSQEGVRELRSRLLRMKKTLLEKDATAQEQAEEELLEAAAPELSAADWESAHGTI